MPTSFNKHESEVLDANGHTTGLRVEDNFEYVFGASKQLFICDSMTF